MLVREEHEGDALDLRMSFELPPRGFERDAGCARDREPVDASGDRREGDRPAAELGGDLERAPVAGREQLVFALLALVPDRADGVDHVSRRQISGGRSFRVTRLAAAQPAALLEN